MAKETHKRVLTSTVLQCGILAENRIKDSQQPKKNFVLPKEITRTELKIEGKGTKILILQLQANLDLI